MANASETTSRNATGWTSTQAYVMAAICLLIGLAGGYLVRGSASKPPTTAAAGAPAAASAPVAPIGGTQLQVTPDQLKHMADAQASPMLKQLKREPNNANLLATVGNLYYDAQQYPVAIDYYQRSLKIKPGDTNVRTDLGNALFLQGNTDKAIEQFNTVLKTEPTNANVLMNLGVIEWRGKMNAPAAVAAWEKLLASNPKYERKAEVEQLLAEAKKHSTIQPGVKNPKP